MQHPRTLGVPQDNVEVPSGSALSISPLDPARWRTSSSSCRMIIDSHHRCVAEVPGAPPRGLVPARERATAGRPSHGRSGAVRPGRPLVGGRAGEARPGARPARPRQGPAPAAARSRKTRASAGLAPEVETVNTSGPDFQTAGMVKSPRLGIARRADPDSHPSGVPHHLAVDLFWTRRDHQANPTKEIGVISLGHHLDSRRVISCQRPGGWIDSDNACPGGNQRLWPCAGPLAQARPPARFARIDSVRWDKQTCLRDAKPLGARVWVMTRTCRPRETYFLIVTSGEHRCKALSSRPTGGLDAASPGGHSMARMNPEPGLKHLYSAC